MFGTKDKKLTIQTALEPCSNFCQYTLAELIESKTHLATIAYCKNCGWHENQHTMAARGIPEKKLQLEWEWNGHGDIEIYEVDENGEYTTGRPCLRIPYGDLQDFILSDLNLQVKT